MILAPLILSLPRDSTEIIWEYEPLSPDPAHVAAPSTKIPLISLHRMVGTIMMRSILYVFGEESSQLGAPAKIW